jgi:Spy/CpxP family protein refolding chaperone
MNNEQKAQRYSFLMSEFDKLRNRIADIRLTQVNLTEEQERQIKVIESQQHQIMREINRLMS